jgi:hypothetical protein
LPALRAGVARPAAVEAGGAAVLRITKLADAEYLIGQVALGIFVYRPSGGGPVV